MGPRMLRARYLGEENGGGGSGADPSAGAGGGPAGVDPSSGAAAPGGNFGGPAGPGTDASPDARDEDPAVNPNAPGPAPTSGVTGNQVRGVVAVTGTTVAMAVPGPGTIAGALLGLAISADQALCGGCVAQGIADAINAIGRGSAPGPSAAPGSDRGGGGYGGAGEGGGAGVPPSWPMALPGPLRAPVAAVGEVVSHAAEQLGTAVAGVPWWLLAAGAGLVLVATKKKSGRR